MRDYLPEYLTTWTRPTLAQRAAAIGADIQEVQIPWVCEDGFFHSYWRRPEAYLQPAVRQGTSVWAVLGSEVEGRAVKALREDLVSGFWQARNHTLLTLDEAELGARLLTT